MGSCVPAYKIRASIVKIVSAFSVSLLLAPVRVAGQFVTLLPPPMSDSSAAALQRDQLAFDALRDSLALRESTRCSAAKPTEEFNRRTCERAIDSRQLALNVWASRLAAAQRDTCTAQFPSPADSLRQECIAVIDSFRLARRKSGSRFWDTSLVLPRSRRQLRGLYGDGLRVFSGFTANVSDKEVLLLTEVVSGAVGVFPFGITHALVVSSADSQPSLSADTVRRATENVLELMNNGGALSARFQYPVLAIGGANVKHSLSAYVQAGLLGPLGQPDHAQGSGAGVVEYLTGLAIRKPDSTAVLLGELVVGVRLGVARTFSGPILQGVDQDRSFAFYQLGIGLQQSGSLRLSVLLNHVTSGASARFVPDVILNLAALR